MPQHEKASGKLKVTKRSDSEQVTAYMAALEHPLKDEVEAIRVIIKSNKNLLERIKWAAPSYYYKVDLVTFNLRSTTRVMLVFHHEAIVHIASRLLEGSYKDRRLMYYDSMAAVKTNKAELERILTAYTAAIDQLMP